MLKHRACQIARIVRRRLCTNVKKILDPLTAYLPRSTGAARRVSAPRPIPTDCGGLDAHTHYIRTAPHPKAAHFFFSIFIVASPSPSTQITDPRRMRDGIRPFLAYPYAHIDTPICLRRTASRLSASSHSRPRTNTFSAPLQLTRTDSGSSGGGGRAPARSLPACLHRRVPRGCSCPRPASKQSQKKPRRAKRQRE